MILQHTKLISSDKTHAGSFLGITSNSPQMEAAMLAAEEGYSLLAKYIFSHVMFREGRCAACQSYTCTCLLTNAAVHTGGLQKACMHLGFFTEVLSLLVSIKLVTWEKYLG